MPACLWGRAVAPRPDESDGERPDRGDRATTFRLGRIRWGKRDRPPPRVRLVCAVCGRILIGLTPERAAVYQKDHQDATGHAVRVEPVPSAR
jgi:hypothetical protein